MIAGVLPPTDPWLWQHEEVTVIPDTLTDSQKQWEIDRARVKLLRAIRHYCKCTDEEAEARLTFEWSGWHPAFSHDPYADETTVMRGYKRGWWSAFPKREAA